MVWVWLVAAAFLPVLLIMAVSNLSTVLDHLGALTRRLHLRRRPEPRHPAVEQLAADLRRLSEHLAEIEQSNQLHRAERLHAAVLAYDDVLLQACQTLEIEIRADLPLRPIERLETEAALAQEGLVW
ncbi:MAG: hypothetical protein QOE19_112 [Actinomycetota bacterium]|jgi:hypothetical protein|nr:hypothetical protein [Actinomycetota bacterium]MDQ1665527.1 hypothetical protein [Actinomycetota bacterium]MDQ1668399.1 hypothetical protein [Actinomycetota bacterium]